MLQAVATPTFAPWHRSDRAFVAAGVALIWLFILIGFVPEMIAHVRSSPTPYPPIVHVHAAAFFGWLMLLTVQLVLIRSNRWVLHRRLGKYGAALAAAMVVLGPATAWVVDRAGLGTARSDPSFLVIQVTDIIGFAGLVIAGIAWRGRPAAHKRLILLATMYLTDAGFARFSFAWLYVHLGGGYWATLVEGYLGADLLIVGLGAYDLATRRRFHPVYLPAVAWLFAIELVATWLYLAPWFKPVALAILRA